MIKQEDGKWKLYTADGKKLLGTHDTKEEAIDQEAAIKANAAAHSARKPDANGNMRIPIDLAKRVPKTIPFLKK